jgi:tetratricopeptide (TPR) repeat protein
MKRLHLSALLLFLLFSPFLSAQSVRIEQKSLFLPTYEIGQPDVNPIFYTGRVYQGAQGHIYPYPLFDLLTDNKVDKEYSALYLDNEYVNVCVLPEIGGRILSATDKTNNYEIFYKQTGIKPALIGMLGAWLSGGVEWNFPHHHRPSSYMPIDWEITENEDGSKTVWVGETELRHRLKWSIGITVYPDRSWVEARVKIMNRSPFIQSILYWANVSVHSNENYEVIFPPETQAGTDHSKVYFTHWPIGEAVRNSGENVSLNWWKNYTGSSRSIFAWNFEDDFLAGYDHGKNAGTVHVANHHIVNGKKFFLWGNNPGGEIWNTMLSDKDGHYLELMVGAYSDNQPDYSWIGPGETREFVQRWYGIRDIKSVKNATDDAAVNLERISSDKVFLGFNATTKYRNAKVLLTQNGKTIYEQIISIDPATPYVKEISVSSNVKIHELKAILLDTTGKELVAYQPIVLEEKPLPEVISGTKPINEYGTVEELYLAGLRVEQFHNARLNPMDFYNEALRRDSGDARVNTVVGIRYARMGEWASAEKHLLRALARSTNDYTIAKDPEPHYYLGLIYQLQGRYKDAAGHYWKATWYPTFQHPAYYALAQISCLQGDYEIAKKHVSESLNAGGKDTKALTMKAYLLRKAGKTREAAEVLKQVLLIDPLDYWSLSEQSLLNNNGTSFLAQAEKKRGEGIIKIQELLEVTLDYAHIGAYKEAIGLLNAAIQIGQPYSSSPLVYYYNGYYNLKLGNEVLAKEAFQKAVAQPVKYTFPFRLEEIDIFNAALAYNDMDGKGAYCLGNLYYYLGQKEKGVSEWERATLLMPQFAQAYRNIGFGYQQAGETAKAITALEKGISYNKADPRYFQELDILYEQTNKPVKERLNLMEKNLNTILKHDDAVLRILALYNETEAYDKAIKILETRHFHVWEGGGQVHNIYVDSHLLKGMKLLNGKKYDAAIKEFELADLYPDNLEVGRPANGGHSPKGFYYMGEAYKQTGNATKAKECYETAVAAEQRRRHWATIPMSDDGFFRALAMREIGRSTEAEQLIKTLKEQIDGQLNSQVVVDEYSKFGEDGSRAERLATLHYLNGLVHWANGDMTKAKEEFRISTQMNQNLSWPKLFLNR